MMFVLLAGCSGGSDVMLPTRVQLDVAPQVATPSPFLTSETRDTLAATAEVASTPAPQTLEFWQAVTGTISEGQTSQWTFEADAGDSIRIAALAVEDAPLEFSLRLLSVAGDLVGEGNPLLAELPADGTYTVLVESSGAGSYELGLGYTDQPNPNQQASASLPQVVGVPTATPAFAANTTFIGDLDSNAPASGELVNTLDHLYVFEGQAGSYVQLVMERVFGQIDPLLTVYSPAGDALAMDDDSGGNDAALVRNLRLPEDGLYSVQVGGRGMAGGYTLRLLTSPQAVPVTPTIITPPTATPVPTLPAPTVAIAQMGQQLQDHVAYLGTIAGPDDVAIFSIRAEAGALFSLAVSRAENSLFRPKVEIVNPDGQIAATVEANRADPLAEAYIPGFRADLPGTYQVFVTSQDGSVGDFIIAYGTGSTREDSLRGTIVADQQVEASIVRRGLRDLWTVELNEGDIIAAAVFVPPGSTLDPILEIVPVTNPDAILAIDDNTGGGVNALINNLRIPFNGQYVLRVKAAGGASTGTYSLIWRRISLGPTPTPLPGVALVLSVDDIVVAQQYAFFPFQGRAGQQVRVRVLAAEGSGFDPVAALLDPAGEIISEADDVDGLNPVLSLILPVDGTYQVRVNGYLNGGPFRVLVEEVY
ncbi:MAG: PPC domain-containing protein [bacterium]|nr:PPC domain-containing protein [bacterium]